MSMKLADVLPIDDLKQQIRHVLLEREDQGIEPRFFLRDNDQFILKTWMQF